MILAPSMMEVDINNSHLNEMRALKGSTSEKDTKRSAESNGSSTVFVNHAAIAWHENRRKWTGDQSRRTQKTPKDPIISWSMTYEDLLSTNDSFPERIPLETIKGERDNLSGTEGEMVDFLVDIWHDEGLYD